MSRILLVRSDALGDLLLTLPVARSLKAALPDSEITMLVAEYAAPLLENESYLDDVITLSGRNVSGLAEFRALVERLRAQDFDTVLHLYPRPALALATQLAGIKTRVGTAYRWYSFLFTERAEVHRRDSGKHELDLNYELAESFKASLQRYEPALTVSDSQRRAANSLLDEHDLADKKFVIIHPLSAGSAPNWSLDYYLELARLLGEAECEVILTGTAAEADRISAALPDKRSHLRNFAGQTDLSTLVGLISLAAAVVCGSTGPIHIATALRTPAVGIYPPQQEISPTRWGPRGGASRLFVPEVSSLSAADPLQTVKPGVVADYLLSELAAGGLLGQRD